MVPQLGLGFLVLFLVCYTTESRCNKGCDLALASYYVWSESNLTFIVDVMQSQIMPENNFDVVLSYNKQIPNKDSVQSDIRINVPFPCDCINGAFLGHVFEYTTITGDTYDKIANPYYANLTTIPWLLPFNNYSENRIPSNVPINVTVNCSCGNSEISKDYGLFVTYPLRPGDTLESVAAAANVSRDLVQRYNDGINFSQGSGLVYIPGRDQDNSYRPLKNTGSLDISAYWFYEDYPHSDIWTSDMHCSGWSALSVTLCVFWILQKEEGEGGSIAVNTFSGSIGSCGNRYAQYGDVSPKVDVYAFGVVLYELISAKEAVVKANGSLAESKGLVALFEDALNQPDPKEDLCKLVDPRLGDGYPLDSVVKMAQLAKACTQENPQLRPSMRSIVVALMTLSSSTEDWDVGSFYENQALVGLMSGR
ncbi:Chitin elicitor receptor kinase 1 RLK1 putative isoform 2 [Tripterygium wilfordii]|uniref:Chitin elicitor receptor kinase 1 RLK1 putative isoform 2 n=1 Tax=Tripterygium wilfordii TaxID=458696 RepID=A0A7J7DJ50_TRIWF|nr:Chitin elicitor receptor kinase 1 RLK1 putative isoform 2 [Tripterygium wilfordii]